MPPVTIQATGKLPKLAQLVGVLLVCASPVACASGAVGTAAALFYGGMVVWALGRFFGWWFYG